MRKWAKILLSALALVLIVAGAKAVMARR